MSWSPPSTGSARWSWRAGEPRPARRPRWTGALDGQPRGPRLPGPRPRRTCRRDRRALPAQADSARRRAAPRRLPGLPGPLVRLRPRHRRVPDRPGDGPPAASRGRGGRHALCRGRGRDTAVLVGAATSAREGNVMTAYWIATYDEVADPDKVAARRARRAGADGEGRPVPGSW